MIIKRYGFAIIKRLEKIIDKNINIIDCNGIIIASTDPTRIGTIHECGIICAQTKKTVVVTDEMTTLYKGSKQGINLPIIYQNELVGVVGISGNPDEVKQFGLVVKELVELLISEMDLSKKAFLREKAIKDLYESIILDWKNISEKYCFQLARNLGIQLMGHRIIFVKYRFKIADKKIIDFQQFSDFISSESETAFRNVYISTICEGKNNFSILTKDKNDYQFECELMAKRFKEIYSAELYFEVGEACHNISDYAGSYKQLQALLTILPFDRLIVNVKDYQFEILLNTIDEEIARNYIKPYEKLLNCEEKGIDFAIINTLKIYFENDMKVSRTAEISHMHKNTVTYRLSKVRELYPHIIDNTFEFMKLYLAIVLYKKFTKQEDIVQ